MENGQHKDRSRLPPQGLGEPQDEGDSETCVRFGLSKAIANALFVSEKIDIEQSHITICLVQALSTLDREYTPLNPMNPKAFNGVKLYLQDKGNKNLRSPVKNKAWWKVCIHYLKVFFILLQHFLESSAFLYKAPHIFLNYISL